MLLMNRMKLIINFIRRAHGSTSFMPTDKTEGRPKATRFNFVHVDIKYFLLFSHNSVSLFVRCINYHI
jgi:hypothetical protein